MAGPVVDEVDVDVAIVGYGPVAQTLAALLAPRGRRVAIYERYSELYGLPRAVYFDDNTIRVWQGLGIIEEIAHDLLPTNRYLWFGADGELVLSMELVSPGPSGWESGYQGFQPYIEQALDNAVKRLPTASVERGWSAEALEQHQDHVVVTLRHMQEPVTGRLEPTAETTTVRARYVIGADGANSFVRDAVGIPFEDQGFREHWLVVDLRPERIDQLPELDVPCQWCDPARPHMHTRNGRAHRRFEFMLLPGERPEDFAAEVKAWQLLEPWMAPEDGALVRQAVYEFRARLAPAMNTGRVVLAGDAAHTMPPFMGQGLNSGVRDAAALAWRLDLLLRGHGDERLLDSYTAERRTQNEWIVNLSTQMARVSCELDPAAAAERDAGLRAAADMGPAPDLPPLDDGGLVAAGALLAGHRGVQGVIRRNGSEGRFDDVVGRGFVLLTRRRHRLSEEHASFLESIDAVHVALEELDDLDGRLTSWLDRHGAAAVLVRPDYFVFGAVEAQSDLPELLDALRFQLATA
jgi:2-polyprenyl-6-methoxyphenol hydroxylase-like FAD-dependent oxidoreductase